MCIKVINMNNEILKTLLDPGDNFNVTLMGEICKLKSKLLHLRMHESSNWKEVVSAEYIQAVIFTQIPSDALTNSSLSNYLPLIIAKAFSICSGLRLNFSAFDVHLLLYLCRGTVYAGVEKMQDMLSCVSTQTSLALNAFHQSYINLYPMRAYPLSTGDREGARQR